jgi:hypothetical protein
MNWHRLDREKTVDMINSVKSAAEALLFSPITSEAKCTRLPFYTNHLLYRLTNFASLPTFSMDFIGDGEKFVYLDGSDNPIYQINQASGLNLSRDNVIPYLNFFFLNVRLEEGEIIILKDTHEASTIDMFDDERRENINLQPDDAKISQNEAGTFIVATPIFLDGSLVNAELSIDQQGRVNVKSLGLMTASHLQ